jgi:hypothetical protein
MLKHQCAECGKKLSESAVACPKCGAVKPLSGWKKVKPLGPVIFTGIKIAMIPIAIIFLGWAYQSYSKAQYESKRAAAIKQGMSFDLIAPGTYSCSSTELLALVHTAASSGDRAKIENLLNPEKTIGHGYCNLESDGGSQYMVDDIVGVEGMGKAVEFHFATDHENSLGHLYTPINFVNPWNFLAPTPINQDLNAADLKHGMLFHVNNKEFIACDSKEGLARFATYQANNDSEKMLQARDERGGCADNSTFFPDEQLEVEGVEKLDGMKDDIVRFHSLSNKFAGNQYTSIKFVNPSPAPTPSAAN